MSVLPRTTKTRNKTPAAVQITAEQLLREIADVAEIQRPRSIRKIADEEEMDEYMLQKRKEFEDRIRNPNNNNNNIRGWINYARWEESLNNFRRVRSIFERALQEHYRNHTMWLKYAEFEMKNKFINHARNVWDRAVTLLPSIDQLWYKYAHMEEMLGNVAGARQIFQRWIKSQPRQQNSWLSFIKFELRYNEIENAREIFERFVQCHQTASSWISFAKFEIKNGDTGRARDCYERAVDILAESDDAEQMFVAFAEFEEQFKEAKRARCVYKCALDHIPKGSGGDLHKKCVAFEKKNGDKEGIEDAIVGKRRFQCDEEAKNPLKMEVFSGKLGDPDSFGTKFKKTEDGPTRYMEMLRAARKGKKQKVSSQDN